jgi:hypothetical protein
MKLAISKINRLIDDGYSVITIGDKKVPNIKWKEFQTKAMTKDDFAKVYDLPTTQGQGLCTGYNGLEVIDVDLKVLPTLKAQQDFWKEYLQYLSDEIADFEEKFVIYKTINNGYHILYRCAEIQGNQKLAKLKESPEAIIETRGIGGYVFIYEKKVTELSYSDIKEISVKDREMILHISRLFDYKEPEIQQAPEQIPTDSIAPWTEYNSKNTVWDVLGGEFKIVRRLKDRQVIKREGGTSDHSGYVYESSGYMYLFTTGTIYPAEKILSPFAIFAYKYHSGDMKEASRDLYKKGFGSRHVHPIVTGYSPADITIDENDLIFPLDIFPRNIQAYIMECHRTLNASIDYMGCSMLWLMSIIIGNSVKIQVKTGWIESSVLWMAIVGRPGVGKTPNINNIIFPLQKANNSEIKTYIKRMDAYRAYMDLEKKEREAEEKLYKPIKTQFIASDITLEALVELHEENKNAVGVFKDELAGWLKDMNKYRAGSDLEFWLSSWSNKGVALNRKTSKSSFVESPIIPILGGIQPGILNQFFTEENKDNGFIDRVLTCFPDVEVEMYNENEMDPDMLQNYEDFIIAMYQHVKNKVVMYDNEQQIESIIAKFTKGAQKEFKRINNEITAMQNSPMENEYMKSMLPKQKSYIPRFALLINMLDYLEHDINKNFKDNPEDYPAHSHTVVQQSILKAERLSKYFINMSKKIKMKSSETFELKKMVSALKAKSKKEQVQEIHKANANFNRSEAADLMGVSRQTINQWIRDIKESK